MGVFVLSVRQTARIISTYAADVSGVASALFELGGMTVMHDASGCNSTYNTHDEPRWYDMDALVFISGLSELEAVLGDDEKLIEDTVRAAKELSPRFIALAGTPIPMITGCDLAAIAREIESRSGVPSFFVPSNGIGSYVSGAGQALRLYAERFVLPAHEKKKNAVNILGATPLDFSVNGQIQSIARRLTEGGISVQSVWAMGSETAAIDRTGEAEVNLVVSSVGLPVAKFLRERFGTPYVVGVLFGDTVSALLLGALQKSIHTGENEILPAGTPDAPDTVILGESVTSRSLAAALLLDYGICAEVICPVELPRELEGSFCRQIEDEQDLQAALSGARRVIADPLFAPIVPQGAQFFPLPHEAYSGRIYRKQIPNLVTTW